MRNFEIKKAVRRNEKIRISLSGPSGSGKTTSALLLAYGLCPDWNKIGVIDTENRSSVQAVGQNGIGAFNMIEFNPPYDPDSFCQAIKALEQAGCEVIIIDSASHEWMGVGGCLDIVDRHTQASRSKNAFSEGWSKVTPLHLKFLDTIRLSTAHIIACTRAKQQYDTSKDENGRMRVEKLGMGSVTRDGFEYELTIAFDVAMNHHAFINTTGKDRTGLFDGKAPRILSVEDGQAILAWCNSGAEITEDEQRMELISRINQLKDVCGLNVQAMVSITGLENGTANASLDDLKNALLKLNDYISKNTVAA